MGLELQRKFLDQVQFNPLPIKSAMNHEAQGNEGA